MSSLANPFMGFHTNFDPDTGSLTEPGWPNREVLLLWVTDNLEEALKKRVQVSSSDGQTIVSIDNLACHAMDGNVFDIEGKDIEFNEVVIEVGDLSQLVELSEEFFKKNIGAFNMDESPLGDWFDPTSRNEILAKKAFKKMLDEGLYNHLISLIYTPFTKDVFQKGELTDDSPSLFTGVMKRSLKKA